MALADEERWMLVENLRRQEKEDIARVERGEDASGGDFGSYYALLTGRHPEWAAIHAAADPLYLESYTRQLKGVLAQAGLRPGASILDVGCGPGMLTAALFKAFGAEVVGIDISESAVGYARRTYPGCRFEVVAVDEAMRLDRTFAVVHAREFYPFTRTADREFHAKYLEILSRCLDRGGILVLMLANKPRSLTQDWKALSPELERLDMTPLRRVLLSRARIPAWVPPGAARALTLLDARIRGHADAHFYVSVRLEGRANVIESPRESA